MSVYHWDETYDRAVSLFHGPAHPDTERAVLQHFQDDPRRVIDAINTIGEDVKAGRVRSGWGILTKRLTDLKARERLIARDTSGRTTTITNTHTWIRNAGCHMTWDEIEAELFADPEQTPSAEWLLQYEHDTRDHPGRVIFGPLLEASIARTMSEGTQDVPQTGGRLTQWDTPELRAELHSTWLEARAIADPEGAAA